MGKIPAFDSALQPVALVSSFGDEDRNVSTNLTKMLRIYFLQSVLRALTAQC